MSVKHCRKMLALSLSLVFMNSGVSAANLYISVSGNDDHSGSLNAPLATLQKAIDIANPGDTIYLREGRYHERVDFNDKSGLQGNPITITAYQSERVVIDGSRSLSSLGAGSWVPLTDAGHPNCLNHCYKTTLDMALMDESDGAKDSEDGTIVKGIWQLWAPSAETESGYKMMITARWPNYDLSTNHPTGTMQFKQDNRTPVDDSWWDMGGTWGFMKNSWVAQKDPNYDATIATSSSLGYNLHHLENNPAYHDLADLPANDLGGLPLDFSGGSLILNYHSETQFSRAIEADGHQAGTNTITHRSVVDPHDQNSGYFLVEHKNALDQAGEWYFDKNTNEVWLWPEDGLDPTGTDIRGKTQSYGMDMTGSEFITLRGLEFFATAVKCEQDCSDITLEDNTFLYPSWYPRMLGLHSYKGEDNLTKTDKAGAESGEGAIRLKGKNYLLRNNIFAHSDAMIDMNGANNCANDNNHIINNLFHHWSYTGSAQMMFMMNSNCNSSFVRNTMHTNGSKVMLKHGSVDVAWSHVSQFGYFQQDGTAFQCKGGNFENGASNGTERHHIWAVDAMKGLGRWDGNDGVGGLDHHQVAMNVAAHGNIKGDYHVVSNNTTVYPLQPSQTMFKLTASGWLDADGDGQPDVNTNGIAQAEENANSHLYNNVSSGISSDPHSPLPLLINPSNMASNWNGFGELRQAPNFDTNAGPLSFGEFNSRVAGDTVASRLRDPKNFDFRLKATATGLIDQGVVTQIPIIDMNGVAVPQGLGAIGDTISLDDPVAGSQPDIGAYEFDSSNGLEYWIPGYRSKSQATMAVPRDGTATAKVDADLMWLPAQNAVAHVVYLGASEGSLAEVCRFEGDNAFAQGRSTDSLPAIESGFTHLKNICSPGGLTPNQNYVWRVDTIDLNGIQTAGELWSFGVQVPAEEITVVLEPLADTYIDSKKSTTNFNGVSGLKLCTPSSSSNAATRVSYFTFDLSEIEGNIQSAVLRVKRNLGAGTTNETGAYVVDHQWDPTTLTYNDADTLGIIPQPGDTELAFVDKIYEGSWGDFNVTEGLIADQQTLAIALKAHESDSCGNKKLIETIEAETAAQATDPSAEIAPELIIVYSDAVTDLPPQPVTGLETEDFKGELTLTWNASPEADVVGYNVYRRDHHEDSYDFPRNVDVLIDPVYTDNSMNLGATYQFAVRAVDALGQESNDTQIINVSLADDDQDGMSDSWESFYGLNTSVNDAAGDFDADGISNLQEYLDGTDPSLSLGPVTVTLYAVEDTYVDSTAPNSNFEGSSKLKIRTAPNPTDPSSANQITYIKFDLSSVSGTVTSAQLRLYRNSSKSNVNNVTVHSVLDSTWDASTMTWNSKPSYTAAALDTQNIASETWQGFDVTTTTFNHTVTFAVKRNAHRSKRDVAAIESGMVPELVIEYTGN